MELQFDIIKEKYLWRAIRGCPGRFILPGGPTETSIDELLEQKVAVRIYHTSSLPDPVLVVSFPDGGGIISYKKAESGFIHTLNTKEGFERKLATLDIKL